MISGDSDSASHGFAKESCKKKRTVLVLTRHYLPGYRAGGPVRTISALVDRLSGEFEFVVICSDRDLGDAQPYFGSSNDTWHAVGGAKVRYVRASQFGFGAVHKVLANVDFDVVYLNSFFDFKFTQQFLLLKRFTKRWAMAPTVLAPRGEFSPGALGIKTLKKRAYVAFAKAVGLCRGLVWQASSEQEKEDISTVLGPKEVANISIARNLVGSGTTSILRSFGAKDLADDRIRICSLSRITPIKNLDFALQVLLNVRVPVLFSIFGPIEDRQYWERCQGIIERLPPHVWVEYAGELDHSVVVEKLSNFDLFLLPTKGENFGHAIFEALRAGLPLLISDKTPWRNLAAKGIGWDLPLEETVPFARKIEEAHSWDPRNRIDRSRLAREAAESIVADAASLDSNRLIFLKAIELANSKCKRAVKSAEH